MHRIAIACFAVLCISACGKSPADRVAEAAISAATGHKVDVERDGERMTFHGEQGDLHINSGALPASFPKDVWLPSGYQVETAMEMADAMVVHLASPGQVAALAAAAAAQMQAQGWTSSMTMLQSGQGQVVMYEKGARHATLSITEDPGKGVLIGYQLATSKR